MGADGPSLPSYLDAFSSQLTCMLSMTLLLVWYTRVTAESCSFNLDMTYLL